jgi:hypothetical protein
MKRCLAAPSRQFVFSALSLVMVGPMVIERIEAERYGWATFWFIMGCVHVLIMREESRAKGNCVDR